MTQENKQTKQRTLCQKPTTFSSHKYYPPILGKMLHLTIKTMKKKYHGFAKNKYPTNQADAQLVQRFVVQSYVTTSRFILVHKHKRGIYFEVL